MYKVVCFDPAIGGECGWSVDMFSEKDDLIAAMAVRGYTCTGVYQAQDRLEKLQGEPVFDGCLGPVCDGNGVVRYENWCACDLLST